MPMIGFEGYGIVKFGFLFRPVGVKRMFTLGQRTLVSFLDCMDAEWEWYGHEYVIFGFSFRRRAAVGKRLTGENGSGFEGLISWKDVWDLGGSLHFALGSFFFSCRQTDSDAIQSHW